MIVATALLVYVLWNAIVAGVLSFAAAGIGTVPSSLALHVFALWGPLALTVVIFLCLWFDYPKNQSPRLAWVLFPYCAVAAIQLVVAVLYLYVSPDAAGAPLPTLVLSFFSAQAAIYAYGALACVTRDAYRTVEMAVQVPRRSGLGAGVGARRV